MFGDINLQLHNLVIREWLNGGLLPLNLSLCAVIALFLWRSWRELGPEWIYRDGVATACALFWIFAADGARAGFVWIILRTQNRQLPLATISEISNYGFILAALAGMLASLRCIYLFTPKAWGHNGWIGSLLLMLAFLLASYAI